jgi:hypothetical protein
MPRVGFWLMSSFFADELLMNCLCSSNQQFAKEKKEMEESHGNHS